MSSTGEGEHLGIPEAKFVDDVDKFMADVPDSSSEKALRDLDVLYQKYKMLDSSLATKKIRLRGQIPEIKTTLEMVDHLRNIKEKESSIDTHFLLSGSLRAKATIPPTKEVGLWLGANVMLMYSVEEAHELLSTNLESANRKLEKLNEDIDYLRDQITTTEVSMARVYNWDVTRRRAKPGATA